MFVEAPAVTVTIVQLFFFSVPSRSSRSLFCVFGKCLIMFFLGVPSPFLGCLYIFFVLSLLCSSSFLCWRMAVRSPMDYVVSRVGEVLPPDKGSVAQLYSHRVRAEFIFL